MIQVIDCCAVYSVVDDWLGLDKPCLPNHNRIRGRCNWQPSNSHGLLPPESRELQKAQTNQKLIYGNDPAATIPHSQLEQTGPTRLNYHSPAPADS